MSNTRTLRIGSRGSKLALAQTEWVVDALKARYPSRKVETVIVIIKTKGDRIIDKPLYRSPGKGFFVKEIENALLSGEVDLAVHSLKDIPTQLPEGLTLAAICNRVEARDALVVSESVNRLIGDSRIGDSRIAESPNHQITELLIGARVGTSSLRRQAQLRHAFPGWKFLELRGNVDTRLRKLDEGQYDAIVVAAAGLIRLGLQERITCLLPVEVCVPAAGQGALAVEARADDAEALEILQSLDEPLVRAEITAERSVVSALHAGCHAAIGVCAKAEKAEGGQLTVHAALARLDGSQCLRESITGSVKQPEQLGKELAQRLLRRDECIAQNFQAL